MKPFSFILFVFLFWTTISQATETLVLKESTKRSHLTVTGEMAAFKLGEQSLETQGAQVQYAYNLYENLSLEAFVSTAFGGASGLSSSFFGFGGYGMYNIWGNCCWSKRSVQLNQRDIVTEQNFSSFSFLIGGGLDQYLLNGSKGVYSGSGFGLAASVIVPFRSWALRVNAKQSFLAAAGQNIDATFFGAGATFNF